MKKIVMLFICLAIIPLSGCSDMNGESYNINGEIYVTDFYEGLYVNSQIVCFKGDLLENSDDVWSEDKVIIEDTNGYNITYARFDIYSILINSWEYQLYVKEDDFNAAREYYQSEENFYYYVAYSYNLDDDYDMYNIVDEGTSFNAYLDVINNYDGEVELLEGITNESLEYYIYKISIDGLFTTIRNSYYVIDDRLYIFSYSNENGYYGIEIEEEIANYFITLFDETL